MDIWTLVSVQENSQRNLWLVQCVPLRDIAESSDVPLVNTDESVLLEGDIPLFLSIQNLAKALISKSGSELCL